MSYGGTENFSGYMMRDDLLETFIFDLGRPFVQGDIEHVTSASNVRHFVKTTSSYSCVGL